MFPKFFAFEKKKKSKKMNIKQTKNILLAELLTKLNIFPIKISGDLAMYFAINRQESTPSMSINLKKNTALDFGTGKVYDAISLVQEIKKCSVSDALKIISEMNISSSFQRQENLEIIQEKNYRILEVKDEISHPALIQYLQERKVWGQRNFLKEIHYEIKNFEGKTKKYFAVGFVNNSENSFEISSPIFKGCLGKKDITFIGNNSKFLKIFEGFFDFLSFLILMENKKNDSDFLILNSVSLVKKSENFIKKYSSIELYFDNDSAGENATKFVQNLCPIAKDFRIFYKDFKDLNDFLKNQP